MTTATDSHEQTNWWSRPCGGREVLLLAVPLFVSTASWTVMNFIDRMFLLWRSKEAVAAVLPAGMVHFAMISFPLGIAAYTNTFVAQYYGAGSLRRIGPAVWQGLHLGLVCVPLYLALIPLAPWIFAGHARLLADQEVLFFRTALFGAGAEIIAAAMAAFFTGRGVTRVVMLVDSSAWLLNIVLDYGWIFGHFGLPSLGIQGAALATVVALWWRVAVYSTLLMLPRFRRYNIRRGWRFDPALFWRLLRYGGPSGLQMLVEVAGFTLFLLVVGVLGEDALAATNLAFNVNCLAFVPMLGLGIALSTLVGQQLGRGNPELAARATMTSLSMALSYMGAMALFYVLFPGVLLLGYEWGASPAEFHQLRATTVVLLRFVAAYCLFDALNVTFAGTLKGAGDTRFIMVVSLLLTPIPVAAAWVGIHFFGLGLIWCWIVITLWICISGLIYLARYVQGRWRHMRVIEPELIGDAAR
ncbi:MAG: MATE family efflux transporter [Thermoguttaceae bacterium]